MYAKLFPRLLKCLPFLLVLCIFSASIVSATETESPPSGQESPVSEETAAPVSYTHLTLPTKLILCRSRWSPYH